MENDKKLLDGIIVDYYNSVNDLFTYRLRNNWKINTSEIIFIISILFLVLNIIPFFPFFFDNYLLFLFKLIKPQIELSIQEYNFWIRWGVGSITSLLCFGIMFLPYKYWNIKDSKKALSPKYMTFCYAFSLRKEIKSFLINENVIHLEKTSQYFAKVISSITTFRINNGDKSIFLGLNKLREELIKRFDWIKFTNETNEMIDAISSIDKKIKERLRQRLELEKVIPLIETLTLYKFTSIKPEELNSNGIKLREMRNDYLISFAKELNSLSEIESTIENDKRKRNKAKSTILLITSLFSSSNIIVLFISWLILLTILFVVFSIIVINVLNLTIDSTILIALLTAPFLGAITFAATIYTTNKK